ncbi:MAG: hypothetical protein HQK62_14110 [Desulfamplus sp.]|nr:hypothetical protein [Desulfamplus sp.]
MISHTKALYGWKEIAEYIGCSKGTAVKYAKYHGLPVKKIGVRVVSSTRMLENWLDGYGKEEKINNTIYM